MEVKAQAKYVRMSPRKVSLVVDLIRGKKVTEAVNILKFSKKQAAYIILKVLNSAVANAKNNFSLNEANLVVSKAVANPGPTLKRGRFASRGRRVRILKRATHITIILSEESTVSPEKKVEGKKVRDEKDKKKDKKKKEEK